VLHLSHSGIASWRFPGLRAGVRPLRLVRGRAARASYVGALWHHAQALTTSGYRGTLRSLVAGLLSSRGSAPSRRRGIELLQFHRSHFQACIAGGQGSREPQPSCETRWLAISAAL
jgi:hypothetical protein